MRILKTILATLPLIFAGLLWATRVEFLPSQSAFALSVNNPYYWAMHISIMIIFIVDAITDKRVMSYFVAGGFMMVLGFNMYDYPVLHNWVTAIATALAVFNIIYYSSTKERPFSIMNASVGSGLFLIGFLTDVHLFLGEAIAEFAIGVSMVRRAWIEER